MTKTNQNILQRVADPEEWFYREQQALLVEWTAANTRLYWLSPGGRLVLSGADVDIIDIPRTPAVTPQIKRFARRSTLFTVAISKSIAISWRGLGALRKWSASGYRIVYSKQIYLIVIMDDPHGAPLAMLELMPACTEWCIPCHPGYFPELIIVDLMLPLLAKNTANTVGASKEQPSASQKEYITQNAGLDPSKGIPAVIQSDNKLCTCITGDAPEMLPLQLLLCGKTPIDDPDASIVYNEIYKITQTEEMCDNSERGYQMLKSIVKYCEAGCTVQLSLREGFEAKVTEAMHNGKPVVATRTGGIILPIEYRNSGFLVEDGDTKSVADHLFTLYGYTDNYLYTRTSEQAKASVNDEL
ncbi:hypothetical protein HOY82DRAFT_634101 [Tuber indicum]|nr:hypothetical protein HOY82DRAFT_634101 [Tuber indicum]